MRRLSFLIALVLLSACGTGQEAAEHVWDKYQGKPIDNFFMDHGMPRGSYKLQDGNTLYQWSSGEEYFTTPQVTNVSGYNTGTGYVTGSAITTGGGTMTLTCELELLADKKGILIDLRRRRDTMGWVEFSRCHEYFIGLGATPDKVDSETDSKPK